MHNVPIDVLQAVIAHATEKEPTTDIWILLNGQRVQALAASINVKCGEMAGEFAPVLGDQAPLGELLLLGALDI